MTRLLLLGALFSALFGCNAEGDPQDSVDLSEVPFLAPWGAGAVVKIDKTYYFPSEFDPDFDEPLNTCTVSLNDAFDPVPETVLGNFQRALPRGSEDFFSIQIQGDFVSWGLFDKQTGEEWLSRPGGALTGNCRVIPLGGTDVAQCELSWVGEAIENSVPGEGRPTVVEMICMFAAVPACRLFCGDGNSCTIDTCVPESGCAVSNRAEGFICDFEPGVDGRCTADGQCVIPIPR